MRPVLSVLLILAPAALMWSAGEAASPDSRPIYLDRGAAGMTRYLAELRTRASMLMVTAHPDDEDGGMLAMQSRGLGARAALLTLTRGEGGQNAMSDDMYDALGLVRTQELLQADRYYGVSQFWGRAIDYGFSKTREEALEKWGYDRTLSDVVRVIRIVRPLVVTSVFVGAPTDGHGNHQVAGQMAQEAFAAAGDPTRFPEQIREGLQPWSPMKVYCRVPTFQPTKDKTIYDYATDKYVPMRFYDYVAKTWIESRPATNVVIEEGQWHAPTGLTFQQIGREGWGFQKSQNGGAVLPPPSPVKIEYHRYGSTLTSNAEHEDSFYQGIDTSLNGIAGLVKGDPEFLRAGLGQITALTNKLSQEYRPDQASAIAPDLAQGLDQVRRLRQTVERSALGLQERTNVAFELRVKESQFQQALLAALGLQMDASVAPEKPPTGPFASFAPPQQTVSNVVPGQKLFVQASLLNGARESVGLQSLTLRSTEEEAWLVKPEKPIPGTLSAGQGVAIRFSVQASDHSHLTRAYFSRPNQEQPYYDLNDERYRNESLPPYPLEAVAEITYRGVTFEQIKVVQTSTRVEGIGVLQNPLLVAPAISLSVSPKAGAVPLSATSFNFQCTVRTNVKDARGLVHLDVPAGWKTDPASAEFSLNREGEAETLTFAVTPEHISPKQFDLKAIAELRGKTYEEGYRLVGYSGLRPYPDYRPATYKLTGVDVTVAPNLRVGFIPGTGDEVPRALADLKIPVRLLAANDLDNTDLSGLDTIVLGVRAYQVRPELRAANGRLLQYVKKGGVLIVQYQTANFDETMTPYPLNLGNNPEKVVDEFSPVRLITPDDPILSWPNRITSDDFANWEEERGHGFVAKWDGHYRAPIETHDPGQDPQSGGLLVARYGKGVYVYDAFALYRQLPAGVGGAYRLLANLVSVGKSPAVTPQPSAANSAVTNTSQSDSGLKNPSH